MRRSGFTLIELLVAITIFSALMIIVLGSFSRSILSLASQSGLRTRSQAARQVIDRISNDWQYLNTRQASGEKLVVSDENGNQFVGYQVDNLTGRTLTMFLRYPDGTLVKHIYQLESLKNRPTISYSEQRSCQVSASQKIDCADSGISHQDILPDALAIDEIASTGFTGVQILTGLSSSPKQTGFIKVILTIKPIELKDQTCTGEKALAAGQCFKVETTLSSGVI